MKKEIDYRRFRFRIGDTILFNGNEFKVLAYYFAYRFNDYSCYGYTINFPLHDGGDYSYDEHGKRLSFKEFSTLYINEYKAEYPSNKNSYE
jgi:hypothetical protein